MFMYIVVIARVDARFLKSENFGKTLVYTNYLQ